MKTTDVLLRLVSSLHKNFNNQEIKNIEMYMRTHFDELNLGQLYRCLLKNELLEFFNGCMAFLNKYHGFSKEMIPFELDLQDYMFADKIMKRMSL